MFVLRHLTAGERLVDVFDKAGVDALIGSIDWRYCGPWNLVKGEGGQKDLFMAATFDGQVHSSVLS